MGRAWGGSMFIYWPPVLFQKFRFGLETNDLKKKGKGLEFRENDREENDGLMGCTVAERLWADG